MTRPRTQDDGRRAAPRRAVAIVVSRRRRRRPGAILLALGVVVALAAGCGGDSGAAAPDAPSGPTFDAPPGPTPDAAPAADGGPPTDAAVSSPFWRLECSVDTDAGPRLAYDASPGELDGGVVPGTDMPCCDPDGPCPVGLACLQGPTEAEHRCRPTCSYPGGACPPGGVCALFGDVGICLPASREGEPCAPELCDRTTLCVGNSADDAVCRRRCADDSDCEDGDDCLPVTGADVKACL